MTIIVGKFRGWLDEFRFRTDSALAPLVPSIWFFWTIAKLAAALPQLLIEPGYFRKWKSTYIVYRITMYFFASRREARRKEYAKALVLLDQGIDLYRRNSDRLTAPAKILLTRARLLALRYKYADALKALVEFLRAIEIDRSLSRDDRQYLILFAATEAIEALRRNGEYILMDDLKPLWSTDFSALPNLKVSRRTAREFPFRPPLPFEYKPEMRYPPESKAQ